MPGVSYYAVAEILELPNIDESRSPVVVVTMLRQPMRDEAFNAHLKGISALWRRGERFGLVVDVRDAPPLPAHQRRMVAENLDRQAEQHPYLLVGVAVVLSSGIQRGVVSVLTWLARRPFELQPFATVELGARWILRNVAKPIQPSKQPGAAAFR